MTLDERLEAFHSSGASATSAAGPDLLAPWIRTVAAGDRDAFRRRLAWDGLAEAHVLAALEAPAAFPHGSLPPWTKLLAAALSRCKEVAAGANEGSGPREADSTNRESVSRFPELWAPFVRAARLLLLERAGSALAGAAPEAIDALERDLLRQLGAVAELTAYESFDLLRRERVEAAAQPRGAVYREFVLSQLGTGWKTMLLEHPVLARQVCLLADTWADASAELLRRVEEDRGLLRERFGAGGRLLEVETGLSDRHAGGRTVASLRFAEGPRLVYKPRDVAIEAAWSNLLSWLRENGGEALPAPHVLERAGYGFVEFLEPAELGDMGRAREYFRRAGALLCVAWIAGLDDLHRENVIATSGGPAVVDAETALGPQFAWEIVPNGGSAIERAAERWNESFLRSGLLTTLRMDGTGRPVETSGLRGRGGYPVAAKARRFDNPNSDAMVLVWETVPAGATKNLPTLKGVPLVPDDFPQEILDGFVSTYRFLLERRDGVAAAGGPLDRFAGARSRIVLRPSTAYSALLLELSAPGFLRNGVTRSFAIDSINRVFRGVSERPALWLLMREERRALEALDIPRFSVDPASRSIRTASGEAIEGPIVRSGLEAARDRLASMSREDQEEQRALLEEHLYAASPHDRSEGPCPEARPAGFSRRSLLRMSQDIGDEIRALAVESAGGGLTWRTPSSSGERSGEPGMAHGLYGGGAGIVLFLSALGAATGKKRFFEVARAAAVPIAAALESPPARDAGDKELIGACNGLGSLAYALAIASKLASDSWLAGVAERAAARINPEAVSEDEELDVESGAAGAILGLLALEAVAPGSGALRSAVLCGEHLLARRVEMGEGKWAWPSRDGLCLAGFAHGAGGIALALGRLSGPAGRPDFARAAQAACRYEATLYAPESGNWPVLSKVPTQEPGIVMNAWCHGAPGVAISRAGLFGLLEEKEIVADLERAVAATRNAGPLSTDHACCGNAGLVEALLTCGEKLRRPDWIEEARLRASVFLQSAIERGSFRFSPDGPVGTSRAEPGFFRGLSGVGYTLLRVAAPGSLPSVLSFACA